jgi:hypothetical protein
VDLCWAAVQLAVIDGSFDAMAVDIGITRIFRYQNPRV